MIQGSKGLFFTAQIDNKKLQEDADEAVNILKGVGNTAAKIGITFATADALKELYEFADKFGFAMQEITTISKEITNHLDEYKEKVLDVTKEVPIMADEAAKALYSIVSASHDGADGMKILEVSAKAAVGGSTETATAADAITTMLNAYQKSAKDAEKVSDLLFTTVRLGKTDMSQLGATLSAVAPTAAAYGVEMDQVLAAVATLTKQGVPTAVAMTEINAAIIDVGKTLGDGAFEARTLQEAFEEVAKSANGSQQKLLELVPNIRAVKAIMSMTGENFKTASDDLNQMAQSAGAAQEAFDKMSKDPAYQMKLAKNNILAEFAKVGDKMVETAGGIAEAINKAFDSGNAQAFLKVLTAVIIAMGAYKATLITIEVIKKSTALVKYISLQFQLAKALNLTTKEMIAMNLAAKANPYALIAGAVATLCAGIYLLSQRASDAEKAQEKLNKTLSEYNASVDIEKQKAEELFDKLKKAKKGTEEYNDAKRNIINQYGEYLKGLGNEEQALNDVAKAYDRVIEGIEKAAKARYMDSAMKDAGDKYAEEYSWAWNKALNVVYSKFERGSKEAEKMIKDIRASMSGDLDISKLDLTLLDKKQSTYEAMADANSKDQGEHHRNEEFIKSLIYKQKKNKERLEQFKNDLNTAFGDDTKDTPTTKTPTTPVNTPTDPNIDKGISKLRSESEQRKRQIAQLKEDEKQAWTDAQLEIEQGKIDVMQNGFEKERKQAELNYRKSLNELTKRKRSMLEALRDKKELEWEERNPKAKDKGLLFDRDSVTEKDLSKESLDILSKLSDNAKAIKIHSNQEALDAMLQQYGTYSQKIAEIDRKTMDAKMALIKTDENGNVLLDKDGKYQLVDGATQGNIDEIERKGREEKESLAKQMAERDENFKAWANQIVDLSLDQLLKLLNQVNKEVEKLHEKGKVSDSDKAKADAQKIALEKQIEKKKADLQNEPKSKRTLKEWQDLKKTLDDVSKSFDSIGNSIGGVAGETIKTVGSVASDVTSLVSSIVQFSQVSVMTIDAAGKASVSALGVVEKASVILSIASLALSIVDRIGGLFSSDNTKQMDKIIKNAQTEIDELQWKIDNFNTSRFIEKFGDMGKFIEDSMNKAFADIVTNKVSRNLEALMGKRSFRVFRNQILQGENLKKTINEIAKALMNVSFATVRATDMDKWRNYQNEMLQISEMIAKKQQQLDAEDRKRKKKQDPQKIAKWNQEIAELAQQAAELAFKTIEDMMGITAEGIADKLGNALFDAFKSGEDAAKAWGDSVDSIIEDMIKKLFITTFIMPKIQGMMDEMAKKFQNIFENTEGKSEEDLNNEIENMIIGFADNLNDIKKYGTEASDILKKMMEQAGLDLTKITGDTGKGIASVSQESFDKYNGRIVTIQSHTFRIAESSERLLDNSNRSLLYLSNIEHNTGALSEMKRDINIMRSTMENLNRKGGY